MTEVKYSILKDNKLLIENLQNRNIIWRNFAGNKGDYNKNGDRKFTIVIDDPENAKKLADHGWNIKTRLPKNSNDPDDAFYTLEVRIRFDLQFLRTDITQYTRAGKVRVNPDNIGNFDFAEFDRADIVLRPYIYQKNGGGTGIAAQVEEMNVKIHEGVLEAKWAEEEGPGEDDLPFEM